MKLALHRRGGRIRVAGVRRMILGLAVIGLACGAFSATPSADEVLGMAREKAAREGKTIFVDFSASW